MTNSASCNWVNLVQRSVQFASPTFSVNTCSVEFVCCKHGLTRTGRSVVLAKWRQYVTQSHSCFYRSARVSPQTASRSVHPFLHDSPVCPTQRQTGSLKQTTKLGTSTGRGHIYVMHAMRPNNSKQYSDSHDYVRPMLSILVHRINESF